LGDLGILRAVDEAPDGSVVVTITPTYSGCPAMHAIVQDIEHALHAAGCVDVEVRTALAPAWTTDWMSEDGRRKLLDYGIAPPAPTQLSAPRPMGPGGPVTVGLSVRCPRCGSGDTRELSRFGSTSCKSLWACQACREPFDHFKSL
jgi:ring-1,2-phenylacetyl-CoA epoxidase subunit PaaD